MLGAVGVLTMIVAGMAPYRLLLQGQPYRIMWILAAIRIPVAFWLAARLWPKDMAGRAIAILLIASTESATLAVPEVWLSVLAVVASLVILNRPMSTIGFGESFVRSLAVGISAGLLVSACIRAYGIGIVAPELVPIAGLKTYADIMLSAPGPLVWLAVLLCGLGGLIGRRAPGRAFAAASVAVGVAFHAAVFVSPQVPGLREAQSPYGRDLPFIQSYFQQRPHDSVAPPSVYEGIWESTNLIWFDLQATVYFNLEQMSGVLFNRQTAIEGRRRASIVRPFELERYRLVGKFIPWGDTVMITSLLGPPANASPPTRADLLRLCGREEPIDVAILRNDFGDLAAATNGRVYLYDCARVRAMTNGN